MSKGNVFPNALELLDGDVTITDKFGVIRGTFIQNRENSSSICGSFSERGVSFKQDVIDTEWAILNGPVKTEGSTISCNTQKIVIPTKSKKDLEI